MISREEVSKRLQTIVVDQLSISHEEIIEDVTLEQLGADSLDRVEIIMKIEEAFDIEVNDDEAEKLSKFGELVDYITTLKGQET